MDFDFAILFLYEILLRNHLMTIFGDRESVNIFNIDSIISIN